MEIKRSVLVPYPAESMFDLIERAEDYPQFLPWCVSSTILERSDDWVAARIDFKYLQVRFGFQTRNPKRRPEWLHVRMVDGPFKRFNADWTLTPVGDAGCRIHFDLNYEVAEGLLDRVAAKAAEMVARSMMDAFVKRAEDTLVPGVPAVRPVDAAAVSSAEPAPPEAETARVPPPPTPLEIASPPDSEPVPEPDPVPDPVPEPAPEPELAPPPMPQPSPPVTPPRPTAMPVVDPDLLEAVRACPLSAELDAHQSTVLAAVMALHRYDQGQVLAQEGQVDDRLSIVVEGTLTVVKDLGGPDESILLTLKRGDFAHELGFLDGSVRYASLTAAEPSRVLSLSRPALESLIETHPLVLYRVMSVIVRTVHRIQTRLAIQSSELTNYIVKQHGRY